MKIRELFNYYGSLRTWMRRHFVKHSPDASSYRMTKAFRHGQIPWDGHAEERKISRKKALLENELIDKQFINPYLSKKAAQLTYSQQTTNKDN